MRCLNWMNIFVDKFFFEANKSYDGKMGRHEAIFG